MEKKQLLLISKNINLASNLENEACLFYDLTTVKSIHAGYPLALSHLPDIILIDQASLGTDCLHNIQNFKSTHFLNKSFLFLIGKAEDKCKLDRKVKDHIDGYLLNTASSKEMVQDIEHTIKMKRCLTHYWKDSFMALFNLLGHPVVLVQDEKIIAMNDAFKKDFFISGQNELQISDLVKENYRCRVKDTLRKFIKGKHMKITTTTPLIMNGKLREAKVTFSKLDKTLSGQLVMMINFTGKEIPLNEEIGSSSSETEEYFSSENTNGSGFTKREKEIIVLLCKGYKTKEISEALCISTKTIEKHRSNIIKRTHSGTIVESIVFALNHNLIEI